jgi:phosphorylcholine metabolism protein LicD
MEQVLSQNDAYYIHRLFSQLTSMLEGSEITYWLNGGTLLGAIRCGGIIKWDDDCDIAIPLKEKEFFLEMCNKKFELFQMKLVRPSTKYLKVKTCNCDDVWIDICFIDDNGYDLRGHKAKRRYLQGEVFPLQRIQFSTFRQLLPIPNKSEEYLDRIFPDWRTIAVIYNHIDHKKTKKRILLTDELNQKVVYHYK